jgi:hypothetical protein
MADITHKASKYAKRKRPCLVDSCLAAEKSLEQEFSDTMVHLDGMNLACFNIAMS